MRDAFSFLNQLSVNLVLDAATGRGEFITVLKQNLKSYVQIIGIDSSEKSVDFAQKHFPENDVEIYQMNLEKLDFGDGDFDLVCISNSLHHLENPDGAFTEMLRVLRPGGTFVIVEMFRDGEQSDPQLTHIMMHHWLASIDRLFGLHHQETFTRDEIMGLVGKLKLNRLQTYEFYVPVDNPKDVRNCESLKRNLSDTFKRLEQIEGSADLISEGKEIMNRINSVGCATPSRLLITGTKPKKKVMTQGDK